MVAVTVARVECDHDVGTYLVDHGAHFVDELATTPMDTTVLAELSNYLRATGAWTGTDAQIQAKSAGLAHLIAGSPEYQLL